MSTQAIRDEIEKSRAFESRAVKLLLGLSILIHFYILFVNSTPFFQSTRPQAKEWVIETELVTEDFSSQKFDSIKAKKADIAEMKVKKNSLTSTAKKLCTR